MKKILFILVISLCFVFITNAQSRSGYKAYPNSGYGNSYNGVDQSKYFLIDTTAFLLRAFIDALSSNDFGMKRVDLGYWNQFTNHYWLTHDDNDGEYILSRMYGNLALVEVRLFPRDDGHGFMVNPKDKNAVLLLSEVSRLIYLRILLPDLECF